MLVRQILSYFCILLILLFFTNVALRAELESDSLKKQKSQEILQSADVKTERNEIEITLRSVDISNFPKIKIFIEAFNKFGRPLDTLTKRDINVFEKGVEKKVLSINKIPVSEVVAVDFIFVIDQTGSMQKFINAVRNNLSRFTNSLVQRGINYRVGLVLFSDDIEKVYEPTENVYEFLNWLSYVDARGGGDEKENALEALEAASKMKFRVEADRVAVLITDAPYHEKDDDGHGVTNQTTESIIKQLVKNEVRVFSITPPRLGKYKYISKKTRGTYYDIDYPFSTILDNFSNQLTNLYSLTYSSDQQAVPDSIEIGTYDPQKGRLVKKNVALVELGRKLIIENLLYLTNQHSLPDTVKELDILADFMKNKPNITILIEGHTDYIGSHWLNDRLSLKRANSVKDYLVKRGIDEKRIKTIGYGEKRPIASNKTEFGRKLNRRTEIVIVSK